MRGWALVALGVSCVVLVGGVLLAIASAWAAGDWYAPYQPAMEVALPLVAWGLAGTHAAGLVVIVLSARLGWWRMLALLPAALAGFWWVVVLFLGAPTGFGGPARGVEILIYSNPDWALKLIGPPTLAIAGLALLGTWLGSVRRLAASPT